MNHGLPLRSCNRNRRKQSTGICWRCGTENLWLNNEHKLSKFEKHSKIVCKETNSLNYIFIRETGASFYTGLVVKLKLRINSPYWWFRQLPDGSHVGPLFMPIDSCSAVGCPVWMEENIFSFSWSHFPVP